MASSQPDVPVSWERLDLASIRGVVLVIGAPNTGKSTFARYLFNRLRAEGRKTAYLDGDPGQSELSPPTTMTATFHPEGVWDRKKQVEVWRFFIGSTSPRGHMLASLVGAARLCKVVFDKGAECLVYDTSGLVDPTKGGAALKEAKINLLKADYVFAIQSGEELEYLLRPLRRSQKTELVELSSSPAVRSRNQRERQQHRSRQYVRYFGEGNTLWLYWPDYAVFPAPHFALNRILALEDSHGLVIELGIVIEIDRQKHRVDLLTPGDPTDGLDSLRIGDVAVDPKTFQDQPIH
jgi:polynucleotide 5'-hydroxyl-kinase GRC3/NOL9